MKPPLIGWTENFNCHRARVGVFTINVDWASSGERGYAVSFNNSARLTKRYTDLNKAKQAAINLARRKLTEALLAAADLACKIEK